MGIVVSQPRIGTFGDELAISVAQSQNILDQLKNFPNVVQQLNHDRRATLVVLKANGIISGLRVTAEFDIGHQGVDNDKTWLDFMHVIENYITILHQKHGHGLVEEFAQARRTLAYYIHEEYRKKLPRWPQPGNTQSTLISLNTRDSYEFGPKLIIWSCVGTVEATDKTGVGWKDFKAHFSGEPEIKILRVDLDKLRDFERMMDGYSFQENVQKIQSSYRKNGGRALTWDDFK